MTNKLLTWRQRGELWLRLSIRLALAALAVWTALRFGRPLFSLSAPFRSDRPFPLPALFCLARPERREGRLYLVWPFDREGRPIAPELKGTS